MPDSPSSPGFHRYVKALALMTVLLIWWGAATTTKQAGMAFADWPLSLGSVNPPGWLEYMVPFLEHSHRLLATIVGLMTLILFGWSYVRNAPRVFEFVMLFLWLGLTFGLFIAAGAERQDYERKRFLLTIASLAGAIPIAWLVWSWLRRSWSPMAKLSALALLLVTAQAILGGLRVTEVSDVFAVIHGCMAQGFFCLVILACFMSSPRWKDRRTPLEKGLIAPAKTWTAALVIAIVGQLVLGALMRHHHRAGLADTGIFLTGDRWFPGIGSEVEGGDPMILLIMFAHKYWALVVFALGTGLTLWLWTRREITVGLLRHSLVISGLLVAQIAMGVLILVTGSPEHKKFWITNFHVINGLAILATSFALAVRCWVASPQRTILANPESELG